MDELALTPPMGWNSWDCYGASVTEEEVKGNARYMAENLKSYGWEYIVVDIQWYEPEAKDSIYRPFVPLEMDAYSRLIPAPSRFPSSANGKGFKPLSDYIHNLGLKFGIHIMRGIPRQAVHANTPIYGTEIRAREIASTNSICPWNTDMYGVDPSKAGAQQFYDSLFKLYADWGVDYVKVDDIAYSDFGYEHYHAGEVELIRNAIDNCGRDIILSLSPGPALLEYADHLKKNANMWRITGDFWDRWEDLFNAFEKCNQWSSHSGPGHWPDADMLPIGHIGIRSWEHGLGDRWTRFTRDEQITLITLWSIFRSPLMIGCELRDLDDWTLSLLTNEEVLRVLNHSHNGHQIFRYGNHIGWSATDDENDDCYLALFNTGPLEDHLEVQLSKVNLFGYYKVKDLWTHEEIGNVSRTFVSSISSHGAKLFKLSKI
jgi:hypothetical protein